MLKLAWHFDFHSHRNVRIGAQSQPTEVARQLADAGVEEIITFAKGHCGYSYYPTDLPTCYRHPRMVGDPFGDLVQAVTARGIRVLAYVSFGIDGEGARHHPHWRQHTHHGPMESADHFICICPFTPYLEDCLLPQCREILERYPVDGFFFDTMSSLSACYCAYCQQQYRAARGRDIPRDPDDPEQPAYGRFRHDRAMAMLDRVGSFIQAIRPVAVGFNQVGSPPFPQELPPGCNRLTLDFATFGHQSRQSSRCAAYGSTAPKPADVMPTIFNGGWGDWSLAPLERLTQTLLPIWARNCTGYVGDRLHPDNKLAEPTVAALQHVRALRAELAQHFPQQAQLAPDVLLLHGTSTQYGADYRYFALDTRERLRTFDGATDLLLDAGANYAAVAEYCLAAHLNPTQLVVLPELAAISPTSDAALRQYVEQGGALLVIGSLPMVDGQPMNWAGVTQAPAATQDHIYLPNPGKVADGLPVLVRGLYHPLQLAGAQAVLEALPPVDMSAGIKFGWGIAPPAAVSDGTPVLTRQGVGQGVVWTLAAPLCSSYEEMGNWQQVCWLAQLFDQLLPTPRARLRSPYGQAELVWHQNDASGWAVLVHHGGESEHGRRHWPRLWGPLAPLPVELDVRIPAGRQLAGVTLNGQPLAAQVHDGRARATLTLEQAWRVVRFDWN